MGIADEYNKYANEAAELNSSTFSNNVNIKSRLKDGEMLTAYTIGLLDGSTVFRNSLYRRNLGRKDSFDADDKKIGIAYNPYYNEYFDDGVKTEERSNKALKDINNKTNALFSIEDSKLARFNPGKLYSIEYKENEIDNKKILPEINNAVNAIKSFDLGVTKFSRTLQQYREDDKHFRKEESDLSYSSFYFPNEYNKILLNKTNKLFSEGKINTMINRYYDNSSKNDTDEIIESSRDSQYGISKGRNLRKLKSDENEHYENPFCRVWTSLNEYSKISDAIRHSSYKGYKDLYKDYPGYRTKNGFQNLIDNTVLSDSGKVRCAPEENIGEESISNVNKIKKCMFSLENLAWNYEETKIKLNKSQKGPNGGRIMWFPPYNLKFSEQISTSWSENNFIGRGEEILTYVNTVRNGSLSFTLLIDHPSILNIWKQKGFLDTKGGIDGRDDVEENILRYFAGEEYRIDENLKPNNNEVEERQIDGENVSEASATKKVAIPLFFPNCLSGVNMKLKDFKEYIKEGINNEISGGYGYENELGSGLTSSDFDVTNQFGYIVDKEYNDKLPETIDNRKDNKNFRLNYEIHEKVKKIIDNEYEIISFNNIDDIDEYIGEYDSVIITITGSYSNNGNMELNKKLAENRAKILKSILKEFLGKYTYKFEEIEAVNNEEDTEMADNNAIETKIYRNAIAYMTFVKDSDVTKKYSVRSDESAEGKPNENVGENPNNGGNRMLVTEINEEDDENISYDNEYAYFNAVDESDSILSKKIREKVKFFVPAFHSITPEGFNARLTFLQQCSRQGPTTSITDSNGNTYKNDSMGYGNLSFGRPPFCILRIGDFYNTKIAIQSINIDYGDGVPQWDLNPEGVGVQPMLANISISFKFMGGSDLSGPIEQLQNAVSFNYFSNTSAYDGRANINE